MNRLCQPETAGKHIPPGNMISSACMHLPCVIHDMPTARISRLCEVDTVVEEHRDLLCHAASC